MNYTKSYIHALFALGYIIGISLIALNSDHFDPNPAFLGPTFFLGLLVLSVSVMAYLFFWEPIHLYMDGKKNESAKFLLETIGWFALYLTGVYLLVAF